MGFRVVIPSRKKKVIETLDQVLDHPLKRIRIPGEPKKNQSLIQNISYYCAPLLDDGVLEILTNKRLKRTSITINTNEYNKILGRGKNIEYILGDKIKNTLEVEIPKIN